MIALLTILLSFAVGAGVGWALVERTLGRLSDSQLADIYRREHQRHLDGRAGWWE